MSGEGECIVTETVNPLGRPTVRIDRADPIIRICDEVLNAAKQSHLVKLVGDVFTIRGDNRTVIYRIDWTDYDPVECSYRAEWPD